MIRLAVTHSVGECRRGARFSAFVNRAISRWPNSYWQLDGDGRPLGGVLLRRPAGLVGGGVPGALDPLAQLGMLAIVAAIALWGTATLVADQAWQWGAVGTALLGAFGCAVLLALVMAPLTLGPARASWVARRRRAMLFEGVWGTPSAVRLLFAALAKELPNHVLAGYAGSRADAKLYRSMGFNVGSTGVLAGVLDPSRPLPVRGDGLGRRVRQLASGRNQAAPTKGPRRGTRS